MQYTDQQIEDGITALMDRGQNKAVAVRTVLRMMAANLANLVIPAGAHFLFGSGVPSSARGVDGDVYDNIVSGDRYSKDAGVWTFQYRAKGDNGRTPVKGVDYVDGYTPRKNVDYRDGLDGKNNYELWLQAGNIGTLATFLAWLRNDAQSGADGKDGTIYHVKNYDPAPTDGGEGDIWQNAVSLTTERRYVKTGSVWRLFYDNTASVAPVNQAPVVTISAPVAGATVAAGASVNVVAVASDDVSVASVEFLNAGGGSLGMGVKNGNQYTATITAPATAGTFAIIAKATDGAGLSTTASVTVTVAVASPSVPTITSFTPTSGLAGSSVVITGTNFIGATLVAVNSGAVASFVVNSATQITALLTSSQATGLIQVTTPSGSATSATPFTVTSGSTAPTIYPLVDNMFWDNGLNVVQNGLKVRNPWSYVRFQLPAGVTTFDVRVTASLPHDSLRSLPVLAGGVYQQVDLANINAPTWYTVTVPAGSTVNVLTGYLEAGFTGVFTSDIRVAGVPVFAYPAPPLKRVVGYGTSIFTGAFATQPGKNAAFMLTRAELPAAWRVTSESYSARMLANDYAETSDRAGFIQRLAAMLDGTDENVFLSEIGTNDIADIVTFIQRYGALIDALHLARPLVRIIVQVPTFRTYGGDIAALQNAVRNLKAIRSWLQIYDPTNITAAQLSDGLHLTTAGHRLVADGYIDAILNPPAPVTDNTIILTPQQRTLTPIGTWGPDAFPGYVSSNGQFSVDLNARDSFSFEGVGFDINSIASPQGGPISIYVSPAGQNTFTLFGTASQFASPPTTGTIFSRRDLTFGAYDAYICQTTPNGNGLIADQVVIYKSNPGGGTAPVTPLVKAYDYPGIVFPGAIPQDPNADYVNGKGAYAAAEANTLYWTDPVPAGATGFKYENIISAPYGGAMEMKLGATLLASGNTASGSTTIIPRTAIPAGSNRVLRWAFAAGVTGVKAIQYDKLTYFFD